MNERITPHEATEALSGRTIERVEWVKEPGWTEKLRIVFTDGTYFVIGAEGDDASCLETEPFDPEERIDQS